MFETSQSYSYSSMEGGRQFAYATAGQATAMSRAGAGYMSLSVSTGMGNQYDMETVEASVKDVVQLNYSPTSPADRVSSLTCRYTVSGTITAPQIHFSRADFRQPFYSLTLECYAPDLIGTYTVRASAQESQGEIASPVVENTGLGISGGPPAGGGTYSFSFDVLANAPNVRHPFSASVQLFNTSDSGVSVRLVSEQKYLDQPASIDLSHTVVLSGIYLPNGNTPESEGKTVYMLSGLPSPNLPEPSTFALLGVGAVGLLGYAWRRRR